MATAPEDASTGWPTPRSHSIDEVLSILSESHDDELHSLVSLAVGICRGEAAGITILKDDEYHVQITHGVAPMVCSADDTFCAHTMTTDGGYYISDAQADERFVGIGWVDGRLAHTRFYGSAPIYEPGGTMVGRLCVIDSQPKHLTPLQERALETLAASITKVIELRLLQREVRNQPPLERDDSGGSSTLSLDEVARLAGEISHDMRVPLSSVIASVEILHQILEEHPDPSVPMLLTRAHSSAERLMHLLGRIMEVNGSGSTSAPAPVDLTVLMAQVVADLTDRVASTGATIEIAPLPTVTGRADQLYSVFSNLMANAVKFTRKGVPPRIAVEAIALSQGHRIQVSDNGVGIPEDRRHDVFHPFTRLDPAVSGHGIGLAATARIVREHGGDVGVETGPEGGACFWVTLPR